MNRMELRYRIAGPASAVVAGLSIALAGATLAMKPGQTKTDTPPGGQPAGGRALLVGVTKYDNLPESKQLRGPANDVHLLRAVLQDRYHFRSDRIVSLTEAEGKSMLRPTRENIEREFGRLAEEAREGDQVVVLLAGHGSQEPEDPHDPDEPEDDGLDEIFLPADVGKWTGATGNVAGAIKDNTVGKWLRKITDKGAYVWAIFDCCCSGTMTRGVEDVRELPPDVLGLREQDLARARQAAAQRAIRTRGGLSSAEDPFVPSRLSDNLVALYACRSTERTVECQQPPGSQEYYGLLIYTLAGVLTRSSELKAPLTYRELVTQIQAEYAGRLQGSPTPLVEGRGQNRVVLGTAEIAPPPLVLAKTGEVYTVNAGDLYGLTPGTILAVESRGGFGEKPKLLGYVMVQSTGPFDATVEPCRYEGSEPVKDLVPFSPCRPVFIDYGLERLKLAILSSTADESARGNLLRAVQPLAAGRGGLVELVNNPSDAVWIIRVDKGHVGLVEASGSRVAFPLPSADNPALVDALRQSLERVHRARNLVRLASRFDRERERGVLAVDVGVEVLRHKNPADPGDVYPEPPGGWIFRPGDLISFRVTNKSKALRVDVTLLIVGSDLAIGSFYPKPTELGQSLDPGKSLTTPPPWGQISQDPPFGPETLVVLAAPAGNPPVDFTPLAQDGLPRARSADTSRSLRTPLGELLETAMFGASSRRGLTPEVVQEHGMRTVSWRTAPNRP
jgi:hypothetical protein